MAVTVSSALLAVGVVIGVISLVLAKPLEQTKTKAPPDGGSFSIDVRMPNVQPTVKDTYLCYASPPTKDTLYITAFEPHGNMTYAHHILLYGCAEPGHKDVWDCGEMAGTGGGYKKGPVCKSGAQILYAWAMDAPKLNLPKDVAFKIYGNTGINQLVLQVHYLNVENFVPPKSHTDTSGITLTATQTPQPKLAGVYLMGTGGELAPHSTVYMETACVIEEPVVMHPFAYRAHAHTHGEVVAGYRVRDGKWTELGRISPKLPEMFYNVTTPGISVKEGDMMAARCTMVNKEDRTVMIGETSNDEMCNFYMMYWVKGEHLIKEHYCFTPGPPSWTWGQFPGMNLAGAPSDISLVPGSKDVLQATRRLAAAAEKAMDAGEAQVEADVEQFLEQMQQRLGGGGAGASGRLGGVREDLEENEEMSEAEKRLLEEAARREILREEPGFLERRSSRGGYPMEQDDDEEPGIENLLSSLYEEGQNEAGYGGLEPREEAVYARRGLRDYPQPYNPWLETAEDNYY